MTIEMTLTLEALLVRMADGDRSAFRRLYEDQADWVYGLALRILRDTAAAEDAAQEAFVKLWRTAGRFDPSMGSARTWIGIIARNAALDLNRRRQPVDELDDEAIALLATDAVEPPDPKLHRCLGQLPSGQARAIVTMYTFGLSHSELSERLDLPLGTVKAWVRRGTQSLRICMDN